MKDLKQNLEYYLDRDLSFDPVFQDFIWDVFEPSLSNIFKLLYNTYDDYVSTKNVADIRQGLEFLNGYYVKIELNSYKPGYSEIIISNDTQVLRDYLVNTSKVINHIKLFQEYLKLQME